MKFTKISVLTAAAALILCAFLSGSFLSSKTPHAPASACEIAVTNKPTGETRALPIVMYHSILKSGKGKYVCRPSQFEDDIIAYKKLGYTPVFLREVAAFTEGRGTLPPKPMVITFDDGHYNNLYYALDIIKRHNVKAVINVITSYCETSAEKGKSNPNFSYLTLQQTKELADSGHIEIGNHTHAMHGLKPRYGIGKLSEEDNASYCAALKSDITKAQDLLTKNARIPAPISFAYPFGKYTTEGRKVLQELGFKVFLTCNETISTIKAGVPESLFYLGRYNRSGNISTTAFIKKVFGKSENIR